MLLHMRRRVGCVSKQRFSLLVSERHEDRMIVSSFRCPIFLIVHKNTSKIKE